MKDSLDPRTKILTLTLFAWGIALTQDFKGVVAFLPYILFLFFVFKESPLNVFKKLLPANIFLVFIVITMIFTYNAVTFIDRLKYGFFLFLKSNEILVLTILLLSSSSLFSIFHALHHLKVPKKLVLLLFFTYRYIHTLKEEYETILKAAKCRGFRPKTSLLTYKTYAYIVGNLLVKSYKRADRIYKAMLSRGFKGNFPVYIHFRLFKEDFIFGVISILFFLGAVVWRFLE
ncbi:MAG: energy-coupling factor transporter transmembrane component T [Desulfurobacteriaceae bacterium]